MRALFFLTAFLIGSSANAQQCPLCAAAEACIRQYTHSIVKQKTDRIRAAAAQWKDGQQNAPADLGAVNAQPDINKLKDCLGKIG